MPRHAKAEIVEQADADRNGDAAPQDGRGVEHLPPAEREVEEGLGRGRERGAEDGEEGHEDDDAERAEEALVADGDEGGDGVARHYLLCI